MGTEGQTPSPVAIADLSGTVAPVIAITSLCDYYRNPRAKPGSLLRMIRESKLTAFTTEDQAKALSFLDEKDPHLSRTLKIAGASLPKGPVQKVPATIQWVSQVVRTRLGEEWLVLDDPGRPVELIYRQICDACVVIKNRKKQNAKLALNLAALAAIWLHITRGLEPRALLPALAESGLLGNADGGSVAQGIRIVAAVIKSPVRLDVVRALTALDSGHRSSEINADAALRRLQSEVERTTTDLQAARSRQQLLEQQLKESDTAIAALTRDLEISAQRIRDQRVQSRHDLTTLRDRSSAFLKTLRDRWLQSALEASQMAPPRTAVVLERLEMALSDMEQEVSWLTSLD